MTARAYHLAAFVCIQGLLNGTGKMWAGEPHTWTLMLCSCMNYGRGRLGGWAPLLDILAVPGEFKLLFCLLLSAIFLLPVCLTYWPRKYTTRVDPHVDNFHQVWSWYDHTLPSNSVFVCWYITWLCDLDLTFWPWTAAVHGGSRDQPCYQVWRPYAYPFLSYEL